MDSGSNKETQEEDKKGRGKLVEPENEKGGDRLPRNHFPEGLRLMLVHDDPAISNVEPLLKELSYQVTTCSNPEAAFSKLQTSNIKFDIILTMADIDGFKLLNTISRNLDIPVVLMSSDEDIDNEIVIEYITKGAADFLICPIERKDLKTLYKYVIRHRMSKKMVNDDGNSGSRAKKPRFKWNSGLDDKFNLIGERLGVETVPKKIIEDMGVEGLTRDVVASRLQKYRLTHAPAPSNITSHQGFPIQLPPRIDGSREGNDRSGTKPHQPQPGGQHYFGGLPRPENFMLGFPHLPGPGSSHPTPHFHQGSPVQLSPRIGGSRPGTFSFATRPQLRGQHCSFPQLPGTAQHNFQQSNQGRSVLNAVSQNNNLTAVCLSEPPRAEGPEAGTESKSDGGEMHLGLSLSMESRSGEEHLNPGARPPQQPRQPENRQPLRLMGQWILPDEENESKSEDSNQ